jgi:molecular chaperone DnaK (HSP70)
MSKGDIDEVVLVGGTTRIPLVKDQLRYTSLSVSLCPHTSPPLSLSALSSHLALTHFRKFFEREDLNDKIDPDVTVAYGAASILD